VGWAALAGRNTGSLRCSTGSPGAGVVEAQLFERTAIRRESVGDETKRKLASPLFAERFQAELDH